MKQLDQIKGKVSPVEVSPFLWTRIQSQLETEEIGNSAYRFKWQLTLIALVVVMINSWGIMVYHRSNNQNANSNASTYISTSTFSMIRYE